MPMTPFMGVLISWLMLARNSRVCEKTSTCTQYSEQGRSA